ncbi:MAG: diaminopimelate epimerase [Marinilabiliaceae bacterium]|nr:diaminopimelate epimerase [Marinilabiliaceae bacterium]
MSQTIEFTKMHGLGNDYIYINADRFPIADPAEFSRRWSQYHTAIGSDGLILISRSNVGDFKMRIFNADGSEAMMCGNGSRCVGKYLFDKRLTNKRDIMLETLSGIKKIHLLVENDTVSAATVDMGEPILANTQQVKSPDGSLKGLLISADEKEYEATYVCMGNPHCVIFVDDITTVCLETVGPLIEHSPLFPERTNVEFVQVMPDGVLRMRVWERGSGITQACGTGACATAVAASLTGRAPRSSTVRMDGGDLQIEWNGYDNHIYMTGPAVTAFEGFINV